MSSPALIPDYEAAPAEPQMKRWLSKGLWAVADQGVFAGSNFVLNILLARWLPKSDFGGFTQGYYTFLFLATIHNGLTIEPMLVFGGDQRYRNRWPSYRGTLIRGHWMLAALIAVAMIIGGFCAKLLGADPSEVATFFVMAVTGPSILFLWLMRRTCYVRVNPRRAALTGLLYFVLMMGMLAGLKVTGKISIVTALIVLGVSNLIGAMTFLILDRKTQGKTETLITEEVRADHWKYGKWASITGMMGFVVGSVYLMALSSTDAASFRALSIITMPILQAVQAMYVLLLPILSRQRNTPAFQRTVKYSLIALGVGPLLYWLPVGLFHHQITDLVFKGGKYSQEAWLLWILGLHPALVGVVGVLTVVLQSHERADSVFFATLWSTISTLVIGSAMMYFYGLQGAVISLIINYVLFSLLLWRSIRRAGISHHSAVPNELGQAEVNQVLQESV